jgi:hypothetical protein
VTIGAEIKFSLKTRDANVAEFRRSVALAEPNKTFAAVRQGPQRNFGQVSQYLAPFAGCSGPTTHYP